MHPSKRYDLLARHCFELLRIDAVSAHQRMMIGSDRSSLSVGSRQRAHPGSFSRQATVQPQL
jgi:hypothetical protein